MGRKFMLWFGYPFICIVAALIGVAVFAPGLLRGGMLPMFVMLLAVMAALGVLATIVYAVLRIRAGDSWAEALNPLATMVVLAGVIAGTQFLGSGEGKRTEHKPSAEIQYSPGIKLATIRDGQWRSIAVVGDQSVPFIVDFKTEHLLLKRDDAERLGIATDSLIYDRDVKINGHSVKGAMVTLPSLRIASASISNTTAIVVADPMPENIIGIRPLLQFGDWHIEPAGLILSPAN